MNTTQLDMAMKTPEKCSIKVPSGHILANPKWRKDLLGKDFSKLANIIYSDVVGLVDFYISNNHPILLMSETDMLTQMKECKAKISKLNSMYEGKGTVLLTQNSKTKAEFSDLQEYSVLDFGMFVYPISSLSEVPTVLHKLVMFELKSPVRQRKSEISNLKLTDQMKLITKIPDIGPEKAKLLFERFGNIISISEASSEVLGQTVGVKAGKKVFNFFH